MSTKIWSWVVWVGGSFMVLAPTAQGQGCCSVGTSALGGTERGSTAEGSVLIGGSYHFSTLEQGYNGTRRIDDPLQRTATVEVLGLELEYGLTERMTILAQIGYFGKSRSITIRGSAADPPERVEFAGNGIGDAIVIVKYQLLAPTINSPSELAIGGGAKLPIGRYRQEVGGARLSLDLQAGTGATDLLGWIHGGYAFLESGFKAYGWVLHRYPGANFDNYRNGDETLMTLGVTKAVKDFLELGMAARARVAERDFSNGRFLQSTGGVQFFLVPHFSYLSPESVFRVFGQIPVHQNLYGIQLGISYILGVELRYGFNLTSL